MSGKISREQIKCFKQKFDMINFTLLGKISLAAMIEKDLRKTRLEEDKPVNKVS